MLGDLTGKTALVTGAGSGIGRGIARMLATQNASVAVTDVDGQSAARISEEITWAKTMAMELDVTDQASVDHAVGNVLDKWGVLDVLVCNAGVSSAPNRVIGQDREEDWDVTFAINVRGVVRCCEAVVPYMQDRNYGKIINIASIAGHAPRRTVGAYTASKAAVLRYTKGLAQSLGPHNINVNAICPGAVWTRFQELNALASQRQGLSSAELAPEEIFIQQYESLIPLARPQTPEDIGKMAAFLASEDARNVTGQCIHVDGGILLRD